MSSEASVSSRETESASELTDSGSDSDKRISFPFLDFFFLFFLEVIANLFFPFGKARGGGIVNGWELAKRLLQFF